MRLLPSILMTAAALAAGAPAFAQAAKPHAPAAAAAAPKAATPPAAAPKPPPPATPGESDARCLLSMALLSQDKSRQQAGNIGVFFFTGRLTARGLDIPTAVKAAQTKLIPAQIPAELERCGPIVQAGIKSLQQTFGPKPGAAPPAGAPAAAAPPPAAPAPATPAPK